MHWIYILKCENDTYYVGETKRLYRRFWEHKTGNGGLNTSLYIPKELIAIYKIRTLYNFFMYDNSVKENKYNIYFNKPNIESINDNDEYECDNLFIENQITECLMIHKHVNKVRGGKYTKVKDYKCPENKYMREYPLCQCGFPCDVYYNKKLNHCYFRCAKKNIWEGMRDMMEDSFIIDEPCNFYQKYNNDIEYIKYWDSKKKIIKDLTNNSIWLNNLIGGHYEYCLGGCGKKYDQDYTIRYKTRAINICFDCFIDKNQELTLKYKQLTASKGVCLVIL